MITGQLASSAKCSTVPRPDPRRVSLSCCRTMGLRISNWPVGNTTSPPVGDRESKAYWISTSVAPVLRTSTPGETEEATAKVLVTPDALHDAPDSRFHRAVVGYLTPSYHQLCVSLPNVPRSATVASEVILRDFRCITPRNRLSGQRRTTTQATPRHTRKPHGALSTSPTRRLAQPATGFICERGRTPSYRGTH